VPETLAETERSAVTDLDMVRLREIDHEINWWLKQHVMCDADEIKKKENIAGIINRYVCLRRAIVITKELSETLWP
jgi:hypothetical protein